MDALSGSDLHQWAAQRLLDDRLKTDWPVLLNHFVRSARPGLTSACAPIELQQYWPAEETEWAADAMFRSTGLLDEAYPRLAHHGMRLSQ